MKYQEIAMNKVGIYYAYWTHDWDADFVPYVEKVAQLGFDILEVNSGTVTNMSNAERDRLKTAAQEANIELTYCIGLPAQYLYNCWQPWLKGYGGELTLGSARYNWPVVGGVWIDQELKAKWHQEN